MQHTLISLYKMDVKLYKILLDIDAICAYKMGKMDVHAL